MPIPETRAAVSGLLAPFQAIPIATMG